MDIGDYYSRSINGFTKNPLLGIQAVILYFIIYAIINVTMIYGMLDFFGINIMDYTQSTVPMMNTPDLGAIFGGCIKICEKIFTKIIGSKHYICNFQFYCCNTSFSRCNFNNTLF